jgi:predicted nucleic acid-binding protein
VIVADTNLVVSSVIRGALTKAALAVRKRDADWIAPSLLRSEFLNSLAKYVVVARSLDRDDALKAFRRGLNMVRFEEQPADPVDVLNICSSTGLTAYDAEFVALAQTHNVRIVTLDAAILRAFPNLAVSIADFAAGK